MYDSPDIGTVVASKFGADGNSQWTLNSAALVGKPIFSTESLVNFKSPVVNNNNQRGGGGAYEEDKETINEASDENSHSSPDLSGKNFG